MSRNRFIILSGTIIWILIGLTYVLNSIGEKHVNLIFVAIGFLLAWFLTVITFSVLDKHLEVSPPSLLNYILGSMMMKMFIGLASIAIVAIYFKPHTMTYVVSFLIAYFMLTGFEVYVLIGKLRAVSQKLGNSTDR